MLCFIDGEAYRIVLYNKLQILICRFPCYADLSIKLVSFLVTRPYIHPMAGPVSNTIMPKPLHRLPLSPHATTTGHPLEKSSRLHPKKKSS